MSETRHTPGPWQLFHVVNGKHETTAVTSQGQHEIINWMGFDGAYFQKSNLANARLCAAAPDLLEALKLAQKLFANDHAISRFNWGASALRAQDIRELNETPGKIAAAIQKATEEPQP